MAGLTVGRCAGIFLALVSAVAGFTIGNGMDSNQRKSPLGMERENILTILPVAGNMAVLAGQPQLSLMMVGVTVGATDADMTENRLFMAGDTGNRPMRSFKKEAGFGMVESHRFSKQFPGF